MGAARIQINSDGINIGGHVKTKDIRRFPINKQFSELFGDSKFNKAMLSHVTAYMKSINYDIQNYSLQEIAIEGPSANAGINVSSKNPPNLFVKAAAGSVRFVIQSADNQITLRLRVGLGYSMPTKFKTTSARARSHTSNKNASEQDYTLGSFEIVVSPKISSLNSQDPAKLLSDVDRSQLFAQQCATKF
ncbi:MAG: hypothetical protein Tsb005_11370 [Gammaproteobacteria bacterium]